nr:MAG TPA: hypothetical protein [Caudoviricetes sp.]
MDPSYFLLRCVCLNLLVYLCLLSLLLLVFVSIINRIIGRCSVLYIAHFLFGSFSYKGLYGF